MNLLSFAAKLSKCKTFAQIIFCLLIVVNVGALTALVLLCKTVYVIQSQSSSLFFFVILLSVPVHTCAICLSWNNVVNL